ncbi:MAG TPA: glutathione S-transferase N-terminal domain-containing protein [bacterium]|nr:glutathione S-transferase N-terminal domain-containing protein [bacterium]
MPELYGIAYSPWTAKARWALDHHKIPYRYHEHLILFGMPELRWRLRRFCGDVTVPAFTAGNTRIMDSFEIARHVDVTGSGTPLFPEGRLPEVREINRLSEKALDCARAFTIFRILKDDGAQEEALPRFVPRSLRRRLRWMAPIGARYIAREFGVWRKTAAGYEEDYREVLESLRRKLKDSGGAYLLGRFSFADIAAAMAMQGVDPVDHPSLPMGPATRRIWRHPRLSEDYKDLIAWRDGIFARHR